MQEQKVSIRARTCRVGVAEGGGRGGATTARNDGDFIFCDAGGEFSVAIADTVPAITETPGIPLGERNIYTARCAPERGNGRNK